MQLSLTCASGCPPSSTHVDVKTGLASDPGGWMGHIHPSCHWHHVAWEACTTCAHLGSNGQRRRCCWLPAGSLPAPTCRGPTGQPGRRFACSPCAPSGPAHLQEPPSHGREQVGEYNWAAHGRPRGEQVATVCPTLSGGRGSTLLMKRSKCGACKSTRGEKAVAGAGGGRQLPCHLAASHATWCTTILWVAWWLCLSVSPGHTRLH